MQQGHHGHRHANPPHGREAAMAAASFRAVDASINIAVVTNNATVDKKLFDLHIVPRPDLSRSRFRTSVARLWMPRPWLHFNENSNY